MIKHAFITCIIYFSSVVAVEMDLLYKHNAIAPSNTYEKQLVAHVQSSLEKAMRYESKLKKTHFDDTATYIQRTAENLDYTTLTDISSIPFCHLLNNLCDRTGTSHLHIGLLAGDSLIAALYGNQHLLITQIGVDWFQECPENTFRSNCEKYIDLKQCLILNEACFEVDTSIFDIPIDIYFYDADHCLMAHKMALTYYNDIFADVFVVVIDDWACPWIRKPTFKAFDTLGYHILYESFIPGTEEYGNGQYVAVIKK